MFEICHGCRRCVSLCTSFPTLFDLVDESETMEVDGVKKSDYMKVVDQCYLCDLCYMTKCPYVPPHPWNLDFPHLMLRAKAVKYKNGEVKFRDRMLTSTDADGQIGGHPGGGAGGECALNNDAGRAKRSTSVAGHPPGSHRCRITTARNSAQPPSRTTASRVKAGQRTPGKVAHVRHLLHEPQRARHRARTCSRCLKHNGIPAMLVEKERCCGMPKLELGDLDAVEKPRNTNIPHAGQTRATRVTGS